MIWKTAQPRRHTQPMQLCQLALLQQSEAHLDTLQLQGCSQVTLRHSDRTTCARARKLPLKISTSGWKGLGQFRPAPPGGLWGRASVFWREDPSKCQPFRAQNFDQPVEDPSTCSEITGLRPVNFDPSTSLRALTCAAYAVRLLSSNTLKNNTHPRHVTAPLSTVIATETATQHQHIICAVHTQPRQPYSPDHQRQLAPLQFPLASMLPSCRQLAPNADNAPPVCSVRNLQPNGTSAVARMCKVHSCQNPLNKHMHVQGISASRCSMLLCHPQP
jgi:hypothetical protein